MSTDAHHGQAPGPKSGGVTIPTRISQAFWCNPQENYAFEAAHIQAMMPDPHEVTDSVVSGSVARGPVSWLDLLLEGGLKLPGPIGVELEDSNALTLLITGPPGTGKTTLATELCYRMVSNNAFAPLRSGGENRPTRAVYVTSESPTQWLIDKATSFGWAEGRSIFKPYDQSTTEDRRVGVIMQSDFEERGEFDESERTPGALERIAELLGYRKAPSGQPPNRLIDDTDIIVIDSLNTVRRRDKQQDLYQRFATFTRSGVRLVIVILDRDRSERGAGFWQFLSDVVIHMDTRPEHGYLVRTMEIVKARYQAHVWGMHQLKIYGRSELPKPSAGDSSTDPVVSRRIRAYPFREEGGIAVLPSIHFVLSKYKRATQASAGLFVESHLPGLTRILGEGYPRGRCTGFVGIRGGHKSHLGYVELLANIRKDDAKAIVVSLRDDEGVTRQTMETILQQEWPDERKLVDYEKSGRLDILFYPPGYITPEEFFHRLLLSIARMKHEAPESHLLLLFNSLDQLASRFPLCAREDIFIPGIIHMLSAENVTSFFVAANEAGAKVQYSGLESMAELILSFDRPPHRIKASDYCDIVLQYRHELHEDDRGRDDGVIDEAVSSCLRSLPKELEPVIASVVRFAGGQAAGAQGIVELVSTKELLALYERAGLHCCPLRGAPGAPIRVEHAESVDS